MAYNRTPNDRQRRTKLKAATPDWLTRVDKDRISAVYSMATTLTKNLGTVYWVDHIVPLNGSNMSGLHVPWNLRPMPAKENMSRGNRYDGDDGW